MFLQPDCHANHVKRSLEMSRGRYRTRIIKLYTVLLRAFGVSNDFRGAIPTHQPLGKASHGIDGPGPARRRSSEPSYSLRRDSLSLFEAHQFTVHHQAVYVIPLVQLLRGSHAPALGLGTKNPEPLLTRGWLRRHRFPLCSNPYYSQIVADDGQGSSDGISAGV